MATVPGIDVSYWDSGIDWPKVRATGQRFVFIKATEGETYSDPTFAGNWTGAKTAGLLRGAYCFFHANLDPVKQANRFVSAVKAMNDNGELPPVLDLEVPDGVAKDKIIVRAKAWLDQVEQSLGKKAIIYSGYYFLKDNFSEMGGGPPAWAKDYPLWLAQYPTTYTPGMLPSLPPGWFNWVIWQYSEKGTVNGINASVDMDLFNGTLADLYKFAGVQITPDPTPKTYTIAAGDTFETIANKFGVTLRELVMANLQLLKVRDTLTVPAPVSIPTDGGGGSSSKTYTVAAGDTLTFIAVKFGTTVAALASLNNIKDINNIKVGTVLKIP
jgi:lysozyme